MDEGKAIALGRFALLFSGNRPGQFGDTGPLLGQRRDLLQSRHLLPFERGHIIIQRMARQIKPDGLVLFGQSFIGQPILGAG